MTVTISQSIGVLLASVTDLTAVVGTRINPVKRSQESVIPAVTWVEIPGGEVERVMNQGPGGERLRAGLWQIEGWADSMNGARQLGRIIFNAVDAYHDDGAESGEIVRVEWTETLGADWDDSVKQYYAGDTYKIWWRE